MPLLCCYPFYGGLNEKIYLQLKSRLENLKIAPLTLK